MTEAELFRIYFVAEEDGEDPKRQCRAWKWESSYLPSQMLMDAFEHASFSKKEARFVSLFCNGDLQMEALRRVRSSRKPVIAMGDKVERILNRFGIPHLTMIHPKGIHRKVESNMSHAVFMDYSESEIFNFHIENLITQIKGKYDQAHGRDVLPDNDDQQTNSQT